MACTMGPFLVRPACLVRQGRVSKCGSGADARALRKSELPATYKQQIPARRLDSRGGNRCVTIARQSSSETRNAINTTGSDAGSSLDEFVNELERRPHCNDFVCVSSPEVERTARLAVRDIAEVREGPTANMAILAEDMEYKDAFRSCKGKSKFKRFNYFASTFSETRAEVTDMAMKGTSELVIDWVFTGRPTVPVAPQVQLRMRSVYEINQISGRVLRLTTSWDLGSCSPPAAAFFLATRLAYSVVQAGMDMGDMAARVGSTAQEGGQGGNVYADPTDPRKFFQQEDSFQKDAIYFMLFVAILYTLAEGLKLVG
eukprot:jgi/Mesvir1/10825/Mv07753-RA.1